MTTGQQAEERAARLFELQVQAAGSDALIAQRHARFVERGADGAEVQRQAFDLRIAFLQHDDQLLVALSQFEVLDQQAVAFFGHGGELDHQVVDDLRPLFELQLQHPHAVTQVGVFRC